MKTQQWNSKVTEYKKVTIQDQNQNLYNIVIHPETREIYSDSALEEVNESHKGTFDLDEMSDSQYIRVILIQNGMNPTLNSVTQ